MYFSWKTVLATRVPVASQLAGFVRGAPPVGFQTYSPSPPRKPAIVPRFFARSFFPPVSNLSARSSHSSHHLIQRRSWSTVVDISTAGETSASRIRRKYPTTTSSRRTFGNKQSAFSRPSPLTMLLPRMSTTLALQPGERPMPANFCFTFSRAALSCS